MDRMSHHSSIKSPDADRTNPPHTNSTSPKTIAEIIAFIAGADNKAIEEVKQTYFPILQDAGADAITSFFYTVKHSFDQAETSRKVALFVLLSDCACKAEGKIPHESRLQMIEHLSTMPFIRTDDIQSMMKIAISVAALLQNGSNELNSLAQGPVALHQPATDRDYCARLNQALNALRAGNDSIIESVNQEIKLRMTIPMF